MRGGLQSRFVLTLVSILHRVAVWQSSKKNERVAFVGTEVDGEAMAALAPEFHDNAVPAPYPSGLVGVMPAEFQHAAGVVVIAVAHRTPEKKTSPELVSVPGRAEVGRRENDWCFY
jgi:hypothetical protein